MPAAIRLPSEMAIQTLASYDSAMKQRVHQAVLIVSTLLASWMGMQAVHELGHVVGAAISGADVVRVVLHPLTISRTDVGNNPKPLVVVWAGPIFGVLVPLGMWLAAAAAKMPGSFLLRFFAGFCLIANGLYISLGSFGRIGDCGEMLRHGSPPWLLWLFGAATAPAGLWLWHGQGAFFGLGEAHGDVNRGAMYASLLAAAGLITIGLAVDGW
jgi:hypothetical protein